MSCATDLFHSWYLLTEIFSNTDNCYKNLTNGDAIIKKRLTYLLAIPNLVFTTNAVRYAVNSKDIQLLKWVYENCKGSWDRAWAIRYAVNKNHLHVIKWLYENCEEEWEDRWCKTWSLDYAARRGRLEIVKWLYKRYNGYCTTHAMVMAADSGELHVVKWLHEYTEGDLQSALDSAKKMMNSFYCKKREETIKWLEEKIAECQENGLKRKIDFGGEMA